MSMTDNSPQTAVFPQLNKKKLSKSSGGQLNLKCLIVIIKKIDIAL